MDQPQATRTVPKTEKGLPECSNRKLLAFNEVCGHGLVEYTIEQHHVELSCRCPTYLFSGQYLAETFTCLAVETKGGGVRWKIEKAGVAFPTKAKTFGKGACPKNMGFAMNGMAPDCWDANSKSKKHLGELQGALSGTACIDKKQR